MIDTFAAYLRQGKVKRMTPDPEEGRALLRKARLRLNSIPERRDATFVLEDAYEAVREAAQSLMSSRGFKPYSHEATISFLREISVLREGDLHILDRFRKLRHDSVYRAIPVHESDAAACVAFAQAMLRKIEGMTNP